MANPKKYVIIIDSFRSHNALVHRCFSQHIIPIHIFSSKKTFDENFSAVTNSLFIRSFISEDINVLIEGLDEYKHNILFVFSCTEGGQQLKDTIDNALNLTNKHSSTFANERYNKFALYQTLGQPSAAKDFKQFVKQYNNCIIKPAPVEYSGGCLDVSFINEQTENIEDKEMFFISKFFDGDEYAVDFVSCNGKHKLVAVWKYIRNSTDKIWKEKVELMHYSEDSQLINRIYEVATSWLDKLDHKFGPVHLEIKHNAEQFFCVEINFRLNGHMFYGSLVKQLEANQIDLTINCYTTQTQFSGDLIRYNALGYISRVYLMNSEPERKFSFVNWRGIETHPSVDVVFKHAAPWDDLPISQKTYQSSAAIVIMSDVDKTVLTGNEDKVKEIFNQKFPASS
jgi:hypothetical protein